MQQHMQVGGNTYSFTLYLWKLSLSNRRLSKKVYGKSGVLPIFSFFASQTFVINFETSGKKTPVFLANLSCPMHRLERKLQLLDGTPQQGGFSNSTPNRLCSPKLLTRRVCFNLLTSFCCADITLLETCKKNHFYCRVKLFCLFVYMQLCFFACGKF